MVALAALTFTASSASLAFAQAGIQVEYEGEVVDGDYVPITGVFPIVFALYSDANSPSPFWQESRYVSVWEGRYTVNLGRSTALPESHANGEAVLSVSLGSVGEITRHGITLEPADLSFATEEPLNTVTYADQSYASISADYADRAENCASLNGLTLRDLDHFDQLAERVADLRQRLADAANPSLGEDVRYAPTIGGDGGETYERTCPAGYVATSIRGGMGNLVDSVRLVCQPLE